MRQIIVTTIVLSGVASQYAPGVMDGVIRVRQRRGDISDRVVDGYAAVPNCDNIGMLFRARPKGQWDWDVFMAADCGCPQGYRFLMGLLPPGASELQKEFGAIEVDYDTAVRWDTVGRGIDIEVVVEQYSYMRERKQCLRNINI